ncbi:MAG: dockerin type I domain-containing protein [Candidatus Woesearchaeota archaeon]
MLIDQRDVNIAINEIRSGVDSDFITAHDLNNDGKFNIVDLMILIREKLLS